MEKERREAYNKEIFLPDSYLKIVFVQAEGFAHVRLLHRIVRSVVEELNFEL